MLSLISEVLVHYGNHFGVTMTYMYVCSLHWFKHTQTSLADPRSCAHCMTVPEKILERRLRVTVADSQDPCLPKATAQSSSHQPRARQSWATHDGGGVPGCASVLRGPSGGATSLEEADSDADSDLLNLDETEEVEEPI